MSADSQGNAELPSSLRAEATGRSRVYQASRDQLITEYHHHYAPTPVSAGGAAVTPWPGPDSVRVALADRAPQILRNRQTIRADLIAALAEGGGIHVVCGMGGSGKTALAHWLFHEGIAQGRVGLWVTASDRMTLRAAMLAVAADRGAEPGELLAAYNGQRAAADLVWHYLDRSAEPWLLIIDNADEPAILEEGGWLRASAGGTVLVTSRRAAAPLWRAAHVHRLEVLPLEDAAQVLCDLAPDTGTLQEARAVALRLGCLPLALNLAGSYLAGQLLESWSMSDYHEHLQNDAPALIDQGADAQPGAPDARRLVSQTWQITLDALTAQGRPEATTLLRLLSVLGPDPLPLGVLARGAVAGAGLDALVPALRGEQVEPALRALLDHSLADLHHVPGNADGPAMRCLQVHGIVLDSVHAGIPAEQRAGYVRAAAYLLDAVLPAQYAAQAGSELLRFLVPHATALLHRTGQATTSTTVQLAVRTARHIHEVGDYAAALALATLAGDISQRMHGEDHPDTLAARHQQGDTLQRLGHLQEAERLLRHVHRQRALVLGDDDPRTLQSAVALSIPLYLLGRYDECLLRLEQAIADQRRILGDEHVETLNSRARIMEFYIDSGHLARFSEQGPTTVTDCERHLGTGHPVTAIAYHNLAYGLLLTASPADAKAAAHRAVDARIRQLGPEHPVVCSAKVVLSWALMLTGEHPKAVALMREAVAGRERLLGADHPLSVKGRLSLAERLAAAGQHPEARQLLQDNLTAAEHIFGTHDADLARARSTIPQ